jgi:RHS repeat-associated protein
VDFAADVGGTRISVNSQSASIAVPLATAGPPQSTTAASSVEAAPQQYSTIQMLWNGVNPDVQPTGEDRLSSVSNFLVGNDPSAWKTNVAEYGGVRYANAWNGIDLVYHQADTSALEYDLVVKPGASPSTASFSVQGATAALTDGKLVLTTPGGAQVVQDAPVLYQLGTDGTRQPVAGQFQIRADGSVGYSVGQYDPTRDLVIDPVVNNYCELPGTYDDRAYGIATDSDGNVYLTGSTNSSNFTTTTGAFDTSFDGGDAFVTKLDSMGNVVWSTYLGGSGGDHAGGIAIGPDGGVFVTGATGSSDFPTTGGAYQTTGSATVTTIPDAFLAKLSDDGTSLDYATYLGGTGNEEGKGVAVDQSTGEAVIVGYSAGYPSGTDFPTANAYQTARGGYEDAFVARFTDDGSGLVFSTLLGGSGFNSIFSDEASDVAIDSAGNAFVDGFTFESNFPTVNAYDTTLGSNGSQDAFISEFDPTGTLVASTYYGGSGGESTGGIAVDQDGNVYIGGGTSSSDLPLVNPALSTYSGSTGYLAKFSSLSSAPTYSTYTPGQAVSGLTVDSSNRAYAVEDYYGSLLATRYEADGSTTDWSASWTYPFGALTDWLGAAVDPDGNLWAGGAVGNNPYNAIAVKIGPLAAPIITSVADDTGSSASDGVTYDSSQTITGTAYPSGTVTIYRRGPADAAPVAIGTTYASMYGGGWSYTDWSYPPDGVYTYYAQVTASSETSPLTAPITVTLDTTAPSISLTVATQTYDVTPDVLVTASDLVGFPSPVTVTLDVDLNNNGNYTDGGESGYATAVLTDGVATFDGYTALTPGNTYRFRARITDLAGNDGTSSSTTTDILTSPTNWPGTDVTPTDNSPYGKNVLAVDGMLAAGNVTTSQVLDLDVSAKACDCQDPYLVYNSQEAVPAPVVKATLLSNNALALPSHVYGTLTWDGVSGSTIDYDLSGLSVGGEWLFGAAPTSSLATGRHTYTLSLFVDYDGTTNDHLVTITGATFLANRSASPYGAGWSFSNTDTLVPIASDGTNPAGLLRLYGKGGWGFFTDAGGGTYTSPAGDGGTLVASGGGWVYTSAGGRVLTFNSSGQMTTWAHPAAGETLTYTYDASGGVATMAGPDGGVATFSYSSGLLATIQAPGDRTVTVAYSGSDIAQVVNPDNSTHDLTYTGDLLITDSGLGGNISYAYDSYGLVDGYSLGGDAIIVSGQSAGLGDAVSVGPSHSLPVLYIDPLGAATNSFYNSRGQVLQRQSPVGAVEQYERDSNGFVTKYTDPLNRTTTFTVDAAGNVLGQTKPDSSSASWVYGGANNSLTKSTDPSGGVWTYTNDGYGNPLTMTDPLDHTTTLTYNSGLLATVTDPLGNVTTYLYDAERRPIGGLLGGAVTGTTSYDAEGNANLFTDPLGNVTTTTFDKAGHVRTVTDALGDVTSYAYDSKGRLLSMTDPLGNVTSYAYDSAGRQVAEIDAYGTGLERRTTSVYDDASQLIATIDPLGNRTTSVYDKAGHVIATVDPLGHRTTQMYNLAGQVTDVMDALGRVTHTHYDSQGRVDAVTDPLGNTTTTVYDSNSNVIATVDPLGHRTTSVYDAADRLIASVDALGDRTSYGYDNADRMVTMTDPLGKVTTTQYDPRGNVIFTEDALGNRVTFSYDAADNLVSTTDPLNHTTTSVYDALNRPIATIDALGHRTTAVFDAAGNRTASVDALGHRTSSVYDALNRPVETVDALNNRWTAVYDAADRLVAMVDPLGHRTTSVYDAASQQVATIDALGNRTTNTFDVVGNLVATTNPLNQTTSFAYDALGRQTLITDALNHTWTSTFDAAGRLVGSTDPDGHTVSSVYDDADRLIASVDPLGNRTSSVYDAASNRVATIDPLNHTTTAVFDALNRQIATVDALGNRTTAVFDAAGNQTVSIDALGHRTTATFDALNRVSSVTDALGGVQTTTYDAAGNVRTMVDELGRTTTSTYDAADRQVTVTDALGNVWTSAYDAVGNLVSQTDPLNHTTTSVYDAVNQMITSVDALGHRTTSVFDAAGQRIANIDALGFRTTSTFDARGLLQTVTDPLNHTRAFGYDSAGNPVTQTDPRGNTTTTAFDADNRPVEVTDALGNTWTSVYDAASNVIASIDPLNNTTTAVYDDLNRQIASVSPLGNRTTSTFDAVGNVLTTTNGAGEVTSYGYDALNRQITTTDPLGFVTTSVYDAVGNRTGLIDASGNHTTWVFDALNRVTTETNPLNASSTMAYDAAGRETGETDRLGKRRDFTYDEVGRVLTEKWYAVGGGFTQTQTWSYDAVGQMLTAQDPDGRYTLTYDGAGNVATVAEPFGLALTFGYDAANNRTSVLDSQNGVTTVVFDALNRQTSEQVAGSGVSEMRFDYAYNERGETSSLTRYSDVAGSTVVGTTAYQYDADGHETNLEQTSGAGTVLANDTYTYDAADRVTSKIEDGTTTSFNYDLASQLTEDGASTFGYDATGNRTNSGYVTDPGNRMQTDGVWTYTFDAEGNLTKKSQGASSDTWVYTYDNRNQMTSAAFSLTDGGSVTQQVTYVYDAIGNRIESDIWDGATTTTQRYGMDGWDPAKPSPVGTENFDTWVQLDGSNALIRRRVTGTGFNEQIAWQTQAGVANWYLTDYQGSVRQVIDNSASVVASSNFDAYGNLVSGSLSDRFGFQGMEFESISGTYFDRARVYDPANGQFTSEDVKFPVSGSNPFLFAGNAPTDASDPSGYSADPVDPTEREAKRAVVRAIYFSNAQQDTYQAVLTELQDPRQRPADQATFDRNADNGLYPFDTVIPNTTLNRVSNFWLPGFNSTLPPGVKIAGTHLFDLIGLHYHITSGQPLPPANPGGAPGGIHRPPLQNRVDELEAWEVLPASNAGGIDPAALQELTAPGLRPILRAPNSEFGSFVNGLTGTTEFQIPGMQVLYTVTWWVGQAHIIRYEVKGYRTNEKGVKTDKLVFESNKSGIRTIRENGTLEPVADQKDTVAYVGSYLYLYQCTASPQPIRLVDPNAPRMSALPPGYSFREPITTDQKGRPIEPYYPGGGPKTSEEWERIEKARQRYTFLQWSREVEAEAEARRNRNRR